MVVLNKIYTRTGDAGTTALGSGERVPKHALRIAAYGTVDETNASIGMARVHLGNALPGLDGKLIRIQNDLFDLGADLCVPDGDGRKGKQNPLRVSEAQVQRLEDEIDEMNTELQSLRSFVLPGGSPASAALHVARTVCRRAERLMVELAAQPGEVVA
jgi:cob(I)alamin adenosyltransferase